jgi:hypothetical protein
MNVRWAPRPTAVPMPTWTVSMSRIASAVLLTEVVSYGTAVVVERRKRGHDRAAA